MVSQRETTVGIQNRKTELFQHTQAEQLEWKVPCMNMHINPKILCVAGVPGQLLDHEAVRLQFSMG